MTPVQTFGVTDIENLLRVVRGDVEFAKTYMQLLGDKGGDAFRHSPSVKAQVKQVAARIRHDQRELGRLAKSLETVFGGDA